MSWAIQGKAPASRCECLRIPGLVETVVVVLRVRECGAVTNDPMGWVINHRSAPNRQQHDGTREPSHCRGLSVWVKSKGWARGELWEIARLPGPIRQPTAEECQAWVGPCYRLVAWGCCDVESLGRGEDSLCLFLVKHGELRHAVLQVLLGHNGCTRALYRRRVD